MSRLPPNVILTEAKLRDIPAIHELGRLAFLTDSHTQMKNAAKGDAGSLDEGSAAHMRSLLENPRADVIVARATSPVDDLGVVVGCVTWARRNYDKTPGETTTVHSWGPAPVQPPAPPHRPLGVKDLEAITDQSMAEWQSYFSPENVRCRYIVGLVVHPEHQGKGIGKALMRWGTDRCDEDGVYCWVQSSMGARGAYESVGFREVGRLKLDLDMFAGGTLYVDHQVSRESYKCANDEDDGTGNGGRWGSYVWPYMRRDPVIT